MATAEEEKAAQEAAAAEKAKADAAAAAAAAGNNPPPPDTSKTPVMMPPGALKKLRESERQKGAAQALAKLDADAQEMGFKDHASMIAHVKKTATATPPAPKPPGDGKPPPQQAAPSRNDRKAIERADAERKARQKAERKLREAEQRNAALEARHAIERKFAAAGVKDTDYAMSLLERKMAGMSPEEAEAFDEQKWIGELKKEKPVIFDANYTPIDTTGTAGSGAAGDGKPPPAAPPKPGAFRNAMERDPKTGKFAMSAAEVDAQLKEIVRNAGKAGEPVLEPKN